MKYIKQCTTHTHMSTKNNKSNLYERTVHGMCVLFKTELQWEQVKLVFWRIWFGQQDKSYR